MKIFRAKGAGGSVNISCMAYLFDAKGNRLARTPCTNRRINPIPGFYPLFCHARVVNKSFPGFVMKQLDP